MPTRNLNLAERYDEFVEHRITSGRYENAGEVPRAGPRLLEQRERREREKLAALRALAAEGFDALDRDQAIDLVGDDDLAAFIAGIGRRAAKAGTRQPADD